MGGNAPVLHVALLVALWVAGCAEPPSPPLAAPPSVDVSTWSLSAAQRQARMVQIRDAAAARGIRSTAYLLAGIAQAETGLAHCWHEAQWACQGPDSPDCGGPVIAGAGDGPCAQRQGGLGMFQFDGGTYDQTLQRDGHGILTVAGNVDRAIDFVVDMVRRSAYTRGAGNNELALQWIANFNPNDAGLRDAWIRTVTHYYNGCRPDYGCFQQRYRHYADSLQTVIDETGYDFWLAPPPEAIHAPDAPRPALSPVGPPGGMRLIGPTRVFDTRPGGDARALERDGDGALTPGVAVRARDLPGVSPHARGVWLNLVAADAAGPGYLSVYPAGGSASASTLNYGEGAPRSNATLIPFGDDRTVEVLTFGSEAHLIGDVYAELVDGGAGLRSVPPRRALDTRDTPGPVPARAPFAVDVRAPDGATGVIASLAVISESAGFLNIAACDAPNPESSAMNYEANAVMAHAVISRLSAAGELCVWSSEPVELIVDVTGYLVPDAALAYQPVAPARLLDTRADDGLYRGRLGAGQVVELPIEGLAGAPAAVRAAVVNLTVVDTDERGFLTAFPCGGEVPPTSSLNYAAARGAAAGLTLSALGDGALCVWASSRVHLIVDLLGVWVPAPRVDPPPPGDTPDGGVLPPWAGADAGAPPPDAQPPGVEPPDVGPAIDPSDAALRPTEPEEGGAPPRDPEGPDAGHPSTVAGNEAAGRRGRGVSGCGATPGPSPNPVAIPALLICALATRRRAGDAP